MRPQMKCHVVSALLPFLWFVAVAGSTFECTVEKRQEESVCVFRNVVYRANSANVVFKAPASPKVHHVAFEASYLEHVPREFLTAFPDLKALNVVATNLSTVVIPAKLERLYASRNWISKVIVHQTKDSTSMLELMLDSNQLQDVSNLTRLAKLEILNLSGNKELPVEDAVDLGRFKGLDSLQHLLLSDTGMMYVENEQNVALPALRLLDLSNNDLITSNLYARTFAPLKALEILRLTHTSITELDVHQLTANNGRLKEIYLEGNNFKCDTQQFIVDHLTRAGISTPVDNKNAPCMLGYQKQDDMCCQSGSLDKLVPPRSKNESTPAPRPHDGEDVNIDTRFQGPATTTRTPMNYNAHTTTAGPSKMVPKMDGGNGAAARSTLGNGVMGVAFFAILKLALF